jgi:hypothetical protein
MSHPEPEVRRLVTRRLLMLREFGRLTTGHVQAAARAAATSERTVWRWLQDKPGAATDRPRSRYTLTEADWDGCPVSPDLAHRHLADLRRARFVETAPSWLSH